MTRECVKKSAPTLFVIFRLLIGFLFFGHGAMKMFGWFGGTVATGVNLMWWAGLIEVLVGLGIFFGVLTRLAALGGALEMLYAFFFVHVSKAGTLIPFANGGEAALLFFLAFIPLFIYGAGALSLEKSLFGKELI